MRYYPTLKERVCSDFNLFCLLQVSLTHKIHRVCIITKETCYHVIFYLFTGILLLLLGTIDYKWCACIATSFWSLLVGTSFLPHTFWWMSSFGCCPDQLTTVRKPAHPQMHAAAPQKILSSCKHYNYSLGYSDCNNKGPLERINFLFFPEYSKLV